MYKKYGKKLSPQKFASMVINHLNELCNENKLIINLVAKNARIDKHKDRLNHNESIVSFYD